MIKGKYLVLILLVLLIVVSGTRFLSTTKEKNALQEDVDIYLQEKGYSEADIQHSEMVNLNEHSVKYALIVTFTDEPDVEYFYAYKDGKIMQIDAVDKESKGSLKHLENNS